MALEKIFKNSINVFLLFRNLLLEKGQSTSFEQLESPQNKEALCQVWLKFALWFWRKRFLNFINVFSLFVIISPWKRVGPFILKNLNPLHQRMLCAKFGWNWPNGSLEEDENVKSLRQQIQWQQRRWKTDKFWSEKISWAFSSGELKR